MSRKLISLMLQQDDNKKVYVYLLKQESRYLIRCKYLNNDDLVKETNKEIPLHLVYRLFCLLEKIPQNDDFLGNVSLRIYYSENEYLEYFINAKELEKSAELNQLTSYLMGYVDEASKQLMKSS